MDVVLYKLHQKNQEETEKRVVGTSFSDVLEMNTSQLTLSSIEMKQESENAVRTTRVNFSDEETALERPTHLPSTNSSLNPFNPLISEL